VLLDLTPAGPSSGARLAGAGAFAWYRPAGSLTFCVPGSTNRLTRPNGLPTRRSALLRNSRRSPPGLPLSATARNESLRPPADRRGLESSTMSTSRSLGAFATTRAALGGTARNPNRDQRRTKRRSGSPARRAGRSVKNVTSRAGRRRVRLKTPLRPGTRSSCPPAAVRMKKSPGGWPTPACAAAAGARSASTTTRATRLLADIAWAPANAITKAAVTPATTECRISCFLAPQRPRPRQLPARPTRETNHRRGVEPSLGAAHPTTDIRGGLIALF
jgi:hypothetical protein